MSISKNSNRFVASVFIVLVGCLMLSFVGCKPNSKQPRTKDTFELPYNYLKDAVIYEVNLRQFTADGTIASFRKELKNLKDLGVKILWFMPIQPIGELNRKGSLGSYYSIRDYVAVNPEFGTMEEFKSLVKECHELGFKVILDWVGNHSAFDHRWVNEHPDWYTRDSAGKIVPPVPDWSDVADLNYESPGLRAAMIEAMKFWVKECDIDGYRCDVAFMVPADFWREARRSLDSIKPVFMLAEAEEHDMGLYENAFHAYYGWELHHIMNEVAKGKASVQRFDTVYLKKNKVFADSIFSMNFITNHDENSWNGTEFERMGSSWKAMAVLSYMWPGIPLMYTGQERGLNKRLRFFDKDTVVPAKNASDYFQFYTQLNNLKKSTRSLHTAPSDERVLQLKELKTGVLSLSRSQNNETITAVLNFSNDSYNLNTLPQESAILMKEGLNDGVLAPYGYVIMK